MTRIFIKILPTFLFWIIFASVVLKLPYPESLVQADFIQISLFFLPLYIAVLLTLNIFIKSYLINGSFSLAFISLMLLKALDSLNPVTFILVIISFGLLISYFHKAKKGSLTKESKIPRLTSLRRKK